MSTLCGSWIPSAWCRGPQAPIRLEYRNIWYRVSERGPCVHMPSLQMVLYIFHFTLFTEGSALFNVIHPADTRQIYMADHKTLMFVYISLCGPYGVLILIAVLYLYLFLSASSHQGNLISILPRWAATLPPLGA